VIVKSWLIVFESWLGKSSRRALPTMTERRPFRQMILKTSLPQD
jgi:hypothetical protein